MRSNMCQSACIARGPECKNAAFRADFSAGAECFARRIPACSRFRAPPRWRCWFFTAVASAQTPAPADTDYPGTLKLAVDATDLDHRIFRVREEIPVIAGPLVLFYPEWLPGNHAPRGPIDKLAGLHLSADGKPVSWSRDSSDVYAFHLEVPQRRDDADRGARFPLAAGHEPGGA